MTRCIALLSGGLDSMLAIRIMQEQGIEVEALNFKTMFTCCQDTSAQVARDLGVNLTIIGQEDDYLDLVRNPEYGYGKGANPCVDCRIYMFERAKKFMHQVDAQFIISGEVVGQRPMSQKRSDLDTISYQSGLEDLLLRPLSAKLLPPTKPEREGLVDREKLYGVQGRSRKFLIELAHKYNLKEIPTPSTGCSLTEPEFGRKAPAAPAFRNRQNRTDPRCPLTLTSTDGRLRSQCGARRRHDRPPAARRRAAGRLASRHFLSRDLSEASPGKSRPTLSLRPARLRFRGCPWSASRNPSADSGSVAAWKSRPAHAPRGSGSRPGSKRARQSP